MSKLSVTAEMLASVHHLVLSEAAISNQEEEARSLCDVHNARSDAHGHLTWAWGYRGIQFRFHPKKAQSQTRKAPQDFVKQNLRSDI